MTTTLLSTGAQTGAANPSRVFRTAPTVADKPQKRICGMKNRTHTTARSSCAAFVVVVYNRTSKGAATIASAVMAVTVSRTSVRSR